MKLFSVMYEEDDGNVEKVPGCTKQGVRRYTISIVADDFETLLETKIVKLLRGDQEKTIVAIVEEIPSVIIGHREPRDLSEEEYKL